MGNYWSQIKDYGLTHKKDIPHLFLIQAFLYDCDLHSWEKKNQLDYVCKNPLIKNTEISVIADYSWD